MHVLIATQDGDLRLGLHVALTNAMPGVEFSAVRSEAELLAVAESTLLGSIVVVDLDISDDVSALVSRLGTSASEVVVLGEDASLKTTAWPPDVTTISTQRGTRPVIEAVIAATLR